MPSQQDRSPLGVWGAVVSSVAWHQPLTEGTHRGESKASTEMPQGPRLCPCAKPRRRLPSHPREASALWGPCSSPSPPATPPPAEQPCLHLLLALAPPTPALPPTTAMTTHPPWMETCSLQSRLSARASGALPPELMRSRGRQGNAPTQGLTSRQRRASASPDFTQMKKGKQNEKTRGLGFK